MARTPQPLDWEKIERSLKAGSSQKKIAASIGVDEDTLRARVVDRYGMEYSVFSAKLRSEGEVSIETKQYEKAMDGNIQMLLWLGKVRCGQREPDFLNTIPPAQNDIDKDHLIMRLEHRIAELERDSNANKS